MSEEIAQRLVEARTKAGYRSAAEAARAHGWNEVTYRTHEAGTRGITRAAAQRYAKTYGVSEAWLLTGEGKASAPHEVPVVGYVGAGDTIYPIDDHAMGAGLSYIPAPPDTPAGAVAVVVRGDSMEPAYHDGDILVYAQRREDPERMAGRDRVVWLSDGRAMVKDLVRGAAGALMLYSHNAPPISDAQVTHAAAILWVKKRT